YLPESDLDAALIRLFTARIRLGMFDPPEMVPYTKIDEKELDSAEHRAEARKLANESMVLLKNDGLLPLKPGIRKIAVVGPLADQTRPLIGNYAGQPTHIVSILDGLHAEFPNATINFVPGTQFLRADGTPVPDALLTTPDGKPGLKADYNGGMRGPVPSATVAPLASRTETNVKLTENDLPKEVAGKKTFGVQWSGFLTPLQTGDFLIGLRCDGFGRLSVDGKQVATAFGGGSRGLASGAGRVHLERATRLPSKSHTAPEIANRMPNYFGISSATSLRPKPLPLRKMPTLLSPSSESPVSLKARRCRSANLASSAVIAPALIFRNPKKIWWRLSPPPENLLLLFSRTVALLPSIGST